MIPKLQFCELTAPDPSADILLAQHHRLMRSQSPVESCHVMTAEELRANGARIFVGRAAHGEIKAIGALVRLPQSPDLAHAAELKSMHCHADLRGQGIGTALLTVLIEAARRAGITSLWLETGSATEFKAARRLYEAHGFALCPPFGQYVADPLSVFMTRLV